MDIGEVARRAGVSVATLRHYEEKGLIASSGRKGLRRQFDPDVLGRLTLIRLGRLAGFSLDELGGMLGSGRIDRAVLSARADEVDRTIRRLTALRRVLRHAAACPAERHEDCPSFQKLSRAAARGVLDASALPERRPPRRA
jgi:DNA-binding transcriptional MerR regulator